MWNKFKDFLSSLNPQEQVSINLVKNQTRRSRALDATKILQENIERKFSYQKASLLKCNSCQVNMIALYHHIESIAKVVKSRKTLSPLDYACEISEFTVSDLMVSDNMYIPIDVIGLYCIEAISLCEMLEEAEGLMSGPMAHNLRVLPVQLGTIREVSLALTSCYVDK